MRHSIESPSTEHFSTLTQTADRCTTDQLTLKLKPNLTPREQEIVCLVAFGLSNKQIASRLDISVWTVSTHLRRVFGKLRVDTRAAVVYQCAPLIQSQAALYPEAIPQFSCASPAASHN